MKRKIRDITFFLKNFNYEQLYWYFEFGRSKRKINTDELRNHLQDIDRPVFFLSTGRTGTKWFADLFSCDHKIKAFHAPSPDLAAQNLFAYASQENQTFRNEELNEILGQIFMAARESHLRYSYKCLRRYLETNNHITFFAYALGELLPQSRFIHIHRHPGDFVSSGLKRNWYSEEGKEQRQIAPVKGPEKEAWSRYHTIQKIAWLWKETNTYIETFKLSLPSERVFTFDFSSMDFDSLKELIRFTEARISDNQIRKRITRRLNDQQYQSSEKYSNWTDEEKQMLAEMCDPLAGKYQYRL